MQLRYAVTLVLMSIPCAGGATAQERPARPDSSARADSVARRDSLEAVTIRATRLGAAAPMASTTLDRAAIERAHAGQDAPLALQGLTGVTANSDAGAFSGYSSIRLRGIDQTRLAISLDGIPLNDPEDQVLYFSNVPDFMNSMQSVTLQRGVGASAFGTASFAGSLNFESIPLATATPGSEVQLTAGSWGTRRASVEHVTRMRRGVVAYGRASAQETDGYRAHSGNRASSGFASVGWFGTRDAVKFTGFAGRSRMQLAYFAASEADLADDPRTNPMSPLERDDFHQEMASLQWSRALNDRTSLTTTAYRNGAGGAYDVLVGTDLWNFNLDHRWLGLLSTLTYARPGVRVATGAHVSDYSRDHYLKIRPDLATRAYDNTGFKQEQSVFAKGTWTRGTVDVSGDLQVRRAAFRYRPTPGTGIGGPAIDWVFVNPKVGLSWRARPQLTVFASYGRSGREPTRSDLFGGADDIDASGAADVLPLDQVRPERLSDLEAGVRLVRSDGFVSLNAFAMRFRDEIAPIGRMTLNGTQLRANVARTDRVGVEFEGAVNFGDAFSFSGNTMVMRARIPEYTHAASGTTYRDVTPLLTPEVLINGQVTRRQGDGDASIGFRHVGRAFLANDGDPAWTIPAYTLVDFAAGIPVLGTLVRLQVQNLLGATAYTSGYTDGSTRYLFPVAERTFLVTAIFAF